MKLRHACANAGRTVFSLAVSLGISPLLFIGLPLLSTSQMGASRMAMSVTAFYNDLRFTQFVDFPTAA